MKVLFYKEILVGTQNGPKFVYDLTPDDSLIGENYSLNKITSIRKFNDTRDVYKIKGMCTPLLYCLPGTQLLTKEKTQKYDKTRGRSIRAFNDKKLELIENIDTKRHFFSVPVNNKSMLPEWNGTILNYGGHDTFNTNEISEKMNNPYFWYIIGRYVGDGWTRMNYNQGQSHPGGIVICCVDRDIDSLIDAIDKIGYHYVKTKERTTYRISIYSKELYYFVERFSHTAYSKTIDAETANLPKEYLEMFIKGYLESDGSFCNNNYKISTVSPYLAYGISQCILKTFNTNYRMYFIERPSKTIIEGREVNQRDWYQIVWNQHIESTQKKAFVEDKCLWFPIKEIEKISVTDDFYEIEFETDDMVNMFYALCKN